MPIAPTHRKATFFGILTIGILGIGTFALAMKTFPARLRAPFHLTPGRSSSLSLNPQEELLTSTKDTDRDGVPDVQELQVYKTSPFLEDTDSDGKTDQAEIAAGEDPNCPKGQDCRGILNALPNASESARAGLKENLFDATIISKVQKFGIPGFTDAESVRRYLRDAGVPEQTLAQYSDEELVKMASEALQNTSSPSSSLQPSPTQLPINPTPAEIRVLLTALGMDKALIEKLTDEQLRKVYQEALKAVKEVK